MTIETKSTQFTIAEMISSGVHYGHKKNRWNPQMSPFIYGSKGDIHIIDLTKTYTLLQQTLNILQNYAKSNAKILFVGTKKQASTVIEEFARKCEQYYVNHRWLGGMLTNRITISSSIKTLKKLEEELNNPESIASKKEKISMSRKYEKLNRSLGGIKELNSLPDLVIVFDTNKEALAVAEATKLSIPIIAIVDSNSSLDNISYPIPGNDDSAKATSFFCSLFADTINKARNKSDLKPIKKAENKKDVANEEKILKKAVKKTVLAESSEKKDSK